MFNRDYAGEIREIVTDNLLAGTPLAGALAVVADGIEQQGAHFTAALKAMSERIDRLEAEVLPRSVDPDELGGAA